MGNERLATVATLIALVLLTIALQAGTDSGQAERIAWKSHQLNRGNGSPVDGVWVGTWKADVDPGEGKSLVCETVQVGEHAWKATFNAVCDKDYAFTMEVPGRREGDAIVFAATVDLGQEYGGVYHWTGRVLGDEFEGVYTHAKYNGTFQMKKSLAGVIEPGVSCKVPPPVSTD